MQMVPFMKPQKAIIALPLGVLQANGIRFNPPIPQHTEAFNNIGFDAIIKILMEFDTPFWEANGLATVGFLFADEAEMWATGRKPALGAISGSISACRLRSLKKQTLLHQILKRL
jgi:monoamine oxidase